MLLLALDTSTRQSSLALCSENELYGEYTWYSSNNHSVELLDRIQRVVAESHATLQQLDAIAVALGPGSFNGVRVAVATAKALAFALKTPLIGVSTLELIAVQQQYGRMPICALLEAGRSELYSACYLADELRNSTGDVTYQLRQLGDYQICTPQQIVASLREHAQSWFGSEEGAALPPVLFCGEISQASRQALREQLPESNLFVDSLQSVRHATELAMLARQRLAAGQQDDVFTLEPLYIRRPSITTSTRKQSLLGKKNPRPTGLHTTEREEGALRH